MRRSSRWVLGAVCAVGVAGGPLTGCSTISSKARVERKGGLEQIRAPQEPRAGSSAFELALEKQLGAKMVPGTSATLVQNGEVFAEVERAVRGAKQSIHIDMYIWRPCEVGTRLARVVAERARAGVECRVVVDPAGSNDFGPLKEILEPAGCKVLTFRSPLKHPQEALLRNHRKIVVVDGQLAITGGFGIYKSWTGSGRAKDEWRDTNIALHGPVVAQVQHAFEEDWRATGGQPLPKTAYPELKSEGRARAALVTSQGPEDTDDLSASERMLSFLIGSAKKRLWIANAYFVPSDEMMKMLAQKAKEGVDVRVLDPGPGLDHTSIWMAEKATYPDLVEAGVKIYEYQPTMMHSKTVLVDDRVVAVGSTNIDPLSLKKLREDNVVVEDAELAGQMARAFEADLGFSQQITAPERNPVNTAARAAYWGVGKNL